MSAFQVGDRVSVNDPRLEQLRGLYEGMTGKPAPANHKGVIERIEDGTAIICFDDGGSAPYDLQECRLENR